MELCVDQGRPLIPKFYTFLNCTFRYKYFKFKKKKKERKKEEERNLLDPKKSFVSKNKMVIYTIHGWLFYYFF